MSRVQAVTIRFRQSDTAVAKEDLVLQKYGNCCGRLNYAYRVQEVVTCGRRTRRRSQGACSRIAVWFDELVPKVA